MGMTPKQIQKALREKGVSLATIGRSLRPPVSRVSVWRNVQQIRGATSKRVQKAIAHRIGREPEDVFGTAA